MNPNIIVLGAFVVLLLIVLGLSKMGENFQIEDNTVMGGYQSGTGDFELEGPGDAAWSGY